MTSADQARLLTAEVHWGNDSSAVLWVGSAPVHQYWPLLAPHFSESFLPPQRRMEGDAVAWSWRGSEPGGASGTELAALRTRLGNDLRKFVASQPGAGAREEASGSKKTRANVALLISVVETFVAELLAKSDAELAKFVAQTESGFRLHSWGAKQAARPVSPEQLGREVSGRVLNAGKAVAGVEVLLEGLGPQSEFKARARSDESGHFRFQNIARGRYRVSGKHSAAEFAAQGMEVTVGGEPVTGLKLRAINAVGGPDSESESGSETRSDPQSESETETGGEKTSRGGRWRRSWLIYVMGGAVVLGGIGWMVWSRLHSGSVSTLPQSSPDAVQFDGEAVAAQPASGQSAARPAAGSSGLGSVSHGGVGTQGGGASTGFHSAPAGNHALSSWKTDPRPGNEGLTDRGAPLSAARSALAAPGTSAASIGSGAPAAPAASAALVGSATSAAPDNSAAVVGSAASAGSPGSTAPNASDAAAAAGAVAPGPAGASAGAGAAVSSGGDSTKAKADAKPVSKTDPLSKPSAAAEGSTGSKPADAQKNPSPQPSVQASGAAQPGSGALQALRADPGTPKALKASARQSIDPPKAADSRSGVSDSKSADAHKANKPSKPSATAGKAASAGGGNGSKKPDSPGTGAPKSASSSQSSASAQGADLSRHDDSKPADAANAKAPSPPHSDPDDAASAKTDSDTDQPAPAPAPAGGWAHRTRVRDSDWRTRLLIDPILPTAPSGDTSLEAIEAMRQQLLAEHRAKIPHTFATPQGRRGYAVEISGPAGDGPLQWQQSHFPSSAAAAVQLEVAPHHAELSWSQGAALPPGVYSLVNAQGTALVRVEVAAAQPPLLESSPDAAIQYWLQVQPDPTDPGAPGRFRWQRTSGGALPPTWAQKTTSTGAMRLSAPIGTAAGVVQADHIALFDTASGWGLTTVLTQTPVSSL